MVDGQLIEPERFLIPSAVAKLEEAQQLHPQRPGESQGDYTCRLTQMLTANDPPEVFLDAARQIIEAYGVEKVAERMRAVGDDHFAAGCYAAACHSYSAGIEKHEPEVGDTAHLMHCHVNRAAALIKLGQKELAVQDADAALHLAEGCYAPKTQRKAYLRRAQALFEMGRLDAARVDAERLGEGDSAASALLGKIAEARAAGDGTIV